jgi:hypothetical protein
VSEHRRQPGRKYGPAPKSTPKPPAVPMTNARRAWVYAAERKPMTARQRRQFERMFGRSLMRSVKEASRG